MHRVPLNELLQFTTETFFVETVFVPNNFVEKSETKLNISNPTKNLFIQISFFSTNDIFPMINNVKQSVGKASRL